MGIYNSTGPQQQYGGYQQPQLDYPQSMPDPNFASNLGQGVGAAGDVMGAAAAIPGPQQPFLAAG